MCALAKNELRTFGLTGLGIKPITSDLTSAISHGSLIDIQGKQTLNVSYRIFSEELRCDMKVGDVYSRLEAGEFSVEIAKISLDALAEFTEGTVAVTGTTPDQIQTLSTVGAAEIGYFRLEGKCDYIKSSEGSTDAPGDYHIVLHKCKITSNIETTLNQDGYASLSFSGVAIATDFDNSLVDIVVNETATDIV